MDQTTDEYSLYIPRVALSSASGSSTKSSNRLKESPPRAKNREFAETSGESESEGVYGSSIQNYDGLKAQRDQMYRVHKAPKRGSHSTQSSSASSSTTSNRSNYSVNSLLLSVENLENFNKSSDTKERQKPSFIYSEHNPNIILKSNFYNDHLINHETKQYPIYEHRWKMLQNVRHVNITTPYAKNISTLSTKQEKEIDAISTASSHTTTNFTVVSLNDSQQRLTKSKGICRRSHQITILIMIMTLIFTIGITLMLVLMDMRNKKMPR